MAGIQFPNVMAAIGPLIQMDRQAEESRLNRERLDRHDQWLQQDRAESRDLRRQQSALQMDAAQRAKLKDAAEATTQAAMGVLNAPEAERPAAYTQALAFLKARGHDTSNLPPAYSPGMDGMLRFYIQKAESATEFLKRQGEMPQPMGLPGGAAPAAGDPLAQSASAISGLESGGRYDALGPMTGGDRAYGKYQVMGANIPTWTQEALGRPMTPQEFVASPQAQDAVFKHKFGQYTQQYGSPEAAARAWFAGPGGMNNPGARDVLGTSVADYSRKFNAGMGGPMVAQAGGPPVVPQGDAVAGQGDAPLPPAVNEARTVRERVNQLIPGAQVMGVGGKPVYDAQGRVMVRLPNGQQDALELPKLKDPAVQAKLDQDAKKANTEQANKLRDDFRSEPPVKAYRIVVPMLESAKDAEKRPTRAADLNLIYAMAKLMDPESVVRESEAGMVVATGTIGDRLAGYIGQLNGNPTLQPQTRAQLIAELESRFRSLEASYKEIENAYGEIADANGIKRSHVILPIRAPKPDAPKSGGTYMGPDNSPISWTEIEATAKNRKITPQEVIQILGLTPADSK